MKGTSWKVYRGFATSNLCKSSRPTNCQCDTCTEVRRSFVPFSRTRLGRLQICFTGGMEAGERKQKYRFGTYVNLGPGVHSGTLRNRGTPKYIITQSDQKASFIITHREVGLPIFFAEVENAFYITPPTWRERIKRPFVARKIVGVNHPYSSLSAQLTGLKCIRIPIRTAEHKNIGCKT